MSLQFIKWGVCGEAFFARLAVAFHLHADAVPVSINAIAETLTLPATHDTRIQALPLRRMAVRQNGHTSTPTDRSTRSGDEQAGHTIATVGMKKLVTVITMPISTIGRAIGIKTIVQIKHPPVPNSVRPPAPNSRFFGVRLTLSDASLHAVCESCRPSSRRI